MRNSEAKRYARWSATVAILLAVGVAGVYLRRVWLVRQAEKKAPPAVPSTVAQQSAEFSFSKVEGQRTIYTVRASRTTEFSEGSRNLLEDVSITVYGKKGERDDTLTTRACDFISSTGKITCAGEVQISLQAGGATPGAQAIQVATSAVSFDRDSGKVQTDKPVTFRWPAGEGRATGVEYDSNTGALRLENNVEMSLLASAPGAPRRTEAAHETPTRLTGNSMVFQRDTRAVQMLGAVHAQQGSHELSAGKLVLELDAALHPRHLIASERPQFRDADVQGPMALDADEISAALGPEGSVESIVATGNVHGSRSASAGEDEMQAGRIQMDLATRQNLPRLLAAGGGVILTSHGAAPNSGTRRVESDALEVHLSNGSRPGETRLESVNTLAPSRIEWQNIVSTSGKPVKQTMRMAGRQMNLKFDEQNQLQQLVSTGGVEVSRQLGDGPQQTTASRELTANFTGAGEWATIDQTGDVRFRDGARTSRGERAHLDRAANTATLDGSVVLADATTRTTAHSAVFTQGSNELRADGNVLTTELRPGSGNVANFAPELAHISAEHLVADTVRGRATYSGGARLWQGQTVIEADTIELDNPSRLMVARGQVRGVFPQAAWSPAAGQTAARTARPETELGHVRGGLLTYWEAESRARLEQNASANLPKGSIQANRIDLFFSGPGATNSSKQLTRAVAAGEVTVRQQDLRGTSNRAEYTTSEGKFVLSEGNPTLYDSTGNTTTGRQLTFFFADDRIVVDSEEGSKTVTLHRVEK
jgi:lipopolysaccharide export system protein LptA